MTETVRSSWLLDTGQTREDTRLTMLGATLPADPLKVQTGILPGSADGSARVAGFWLNNQTTMTATVQPGRAVVQGLATQGAYPVTLAEAVVLTFADGDQQPRIDLVCIQVSDASYSATTTGADLVVIKGAPAATPVPPTVPDLALPLYYVSVPAGASAGNTGIPWASAVQDLRTTTVATGGVLPVYGNAAVPGSYTGQLRDHNDVIERWQNGGWAAYPQGIGGIIPPGSAATPSYAGQYRDNNGRLQRWNGTYWDEPVPYYVYYGEAAAGGSTTSTAYTSTLTSGTTTTAPISVTFAVPASGAVMFRVGAHVQVSAATNWACMSLSITQGSTTVLQPSDDLSVKGNSTIFNTLSSDFRVYGLTPGQNATATLQHRINGSGATAYFRSRYVRIDPAH